MGGGRGGGKGRTGDAREGDILNYKWKREEAAPDWLSVRRRTGCYMMSFARPGVSPTDVRGARGRLTFVSSRTVSGSRVGHERGACAGVSVSFL